MRFLRAIGNTLGFRDSSYLAASETAREIRDWDVDNGSANSDLSPEIDKITGRARDLDRNSGLAQNLKNTKIENVIGTGLSWQPVPNHIVLGKTPEWAAEFAKIAKAHWADFSGSRFFDAEGEDNFALQTRQLYGHRFTNGSACVVPMWLEGRVGTRYRTAFKVIESDRLCNEDNALDKPGLSGGVERDPDTGVIVNYHVMKKHPGDHGVDIETDKWEKIPAFTEHGRRKFIHVYHKERAGQSRGASAVASVMAAFGLRSQYQLTELQAAEVASRIAGVMETPLSDEAAQALFGGEKDDYQELRRKWNGKLTSGMILKLPPGTQYRTHIPNRPATAYIGFMEHISREIGLACGLPDQLSMRDFTKVNYSSARGALLEAWRGFYVDRNEIMHQLGDPQVELWMEDAIDLGIFDGLLTMQEFYDNRSACTAGKWLGKGNQPIDRLKHENANKIALEIGTTTLRDIYAEDGEDWEEQQEQTFREAATKLENDFRMAKLKAELSKQYGVELPTPPTKAVEKDAVKEDEDSSESAEDKADAEEDAESATGQDE